jgi:hypothetical protein
MTFSHGSKAKVYLNGYNVSIYLRNFQSAYTTDTAETSTFGNLFKTYTPGLKDGTLTTDGIFDGATDAIDQVFSTALAGTTDDIFSFMPQGDTYGSRGAGFASVVTSYQSTAGIGDVSTVSLQGQNDMGQEIGVVHHILQNEAAPGNDATSIDNGAASTGGWSAYMQTIDVNASLIVKVQDSADNAVWADVAGGTFATVTANTRAAQRLTSATGATLRRYTRSLWTGTGTFSLIVVRL